MKIVKVFVILLAVALSLTIERKLKSRSYAKVHFKSSASLKANLMAGMLLKSRSHTRTDYTRDQWNNGYYGESTKIKFSTWSMKSDSVPQADSIDAKGLVFDSSLNASFPNIVNKVWANSNMSYLPFRNCGTWTCNASGSNRVVVKCGSLNIVVYTSDLWEEGCTNLASDLSRKTTTRKTKIQGDLTNLSTYATTYNTNMGLYTQAAADNLNLTTVVTTAQTNVNNCQTQLTANSATIVSSTNDVNSYTAIYSQKNKELNDLQSQLTAAQSSLVDLQALLTDLQTSGSTSASNKSTYDADAATNLTQFEAVLAFLLKEAPGTKDTLTSSETYMKNLDLTNCLNQLNLIIPPASVNPANSTTTTSF